MPYSLYQSKESRGDNLTMPTSVKAMLAILSSGALWLTNNLGDAFYVLIIAYLIDFVLNYSNRAVFIPKMFNYLGSVAFAYYLQQGYAFNSIPVLRGLIVIIAVHEVMEVSNELKDRLATFKANKAKAPAIFQSLTNDDVIAVEAFLAKMQQDALDIANKPTPEEIASLALK